MSMPDEVWDEAMRRHGREVGAVHELTEDVDGNPLGVHRHAVRGYVIDHTDMEAIARELGYDTEGNRA